MSPPRMTLEPYLDGLRSAATARELERAIQAPFNHRFQGPTWARICATRIESGRRICDAHPHGRFVPRLGPRRLLTVCGESRRVGYGQNGTGERYVWHDAWAWAEGVLRAHGFGMRAAHEIASDSLRYPHRSLPVVDRALAGKLPDPRFDRLIYRGRCKTGPVTVAVDEGEQRAPAVPLRRHAVGLGLRLERLGQRHRLALRPLPAHLCRVRHQRAAVRHQGTAGGEGGMSITPPIDPTMPAPIGPAGPANDTGAVEITRRQAAAMVAPGRRPERRARDERRPCKNAGTAVRIDGGCLRCDADQGEVCRP